MLILRTVLLILILVLKCMLAKSKNKKCLILQESRRRSGIRRTEAWALPRCFTVVTPRATLWRCALHVAAMFEAASLEQDRYWIIVLNFTYSEMPRGNPTDLHFWWFQRGIWWGFQPKPHQMWPNLAMILGHAKTANLGMRNFNASLEQDWCFCS